MRATGAVRNHTGASQREPHTGSATGASAGDASSAGAAPGTELTFGRRDNRGTLREVRALVKAAAGVGVAIRALGGVGVALRCNSAQWPGPLARGYSDVDVIVRRRSARKLERLLPEMGYAGDERFNTLHGTSRLMFDHPAHGHLDVFVEEFVMCHRLKLGHRLNQHDLTLGLGDLLLTKLQVVELTQKDVQDVVAILNDHDLAQDENGIDVRYIVAILSDDWGWWRTVTENFRDLDAALTGSETTGSAHERLRLLAREIDQAKKSIRWRLRSRAGDRVPWREEPEEARA
jgi:hypothetical protein